jgi:hypothetical protein
MPWPSLAGEHCYHSRGDDMAVLFWGLLLFAAGFLLHLIIWRIHKPASPIKALLVVFLSVIGFGLVGVYFGHDVLGSGLTGLSGLPQYLHVVLFSVSMAFAYIVVYTVLEWDSPTLTIVTLLARAGANGLEEIDLIKHLEKLPFLESRIQDLVRGGIVAERNDRYVLGDGYHLFFRSILLYNRLLGTDARSG